MADDQRLLQQKELAFQILDESILTEKLAHKLYMLFAHQFPDDSDFWWQISHEELNHASLLRSIKEYYLPQGLVSELIRPSSDLTALREYNATLTASLEQLTKTPPSREEAFRLACSVEQSVAEEHFQQFMKKEAISKLDQVFQTLNEESLDHLQRLKKYFLGDENALVEVEAGAEADS